MDNKDRQALKKIYNHIIAVLRYRVNKKGALN